MKHSDLGSNVAVQLIVKGSRFEFFRMFRDALAESAQLRREYNEIKRQAARAGMGEYRRAKSEWIECILNNLVGKEGSRS
jgi:GrpB-like predicted nucleotidyltransferase (UPF0157 family)